MIFHMNNVDVFISLLSSGFHADSKLILIQLLGVGSVSHVSEVHATPTFRIKVGRVL